MIIYDLVCSCGHHTEGWFASLTDYQNQADSGLIECPACGGKNMKKKVSAPFVRSASHVSDKTLIAEENRQIEERIAEDHTAKRPRLRRGHRDKVEHAERVKAQRALRLEKQAHAEGQHAIKETSNIELALRSVVEQIVMAVMKNSVDVGSAFPTVVRKMHNNEIAKTMVRGEATSEEVEALYEEGIEIIAIPLPSKNQWH